MSFCPGPGSANACKRPLRNRHPPSSDRPRLQSNLPVVFTGCVLSSNVGGVNSRRSSSASSNPSGTGQVMPTTAARRRYSPTVDRLTPVVIAICRSLAPSACRNLRTSRTFRIGALSAGIGPPLAWLQRAPRPRFDRRHRELQTGLNRAAGFNRNGWPTSVGIGGRIASESLAALRRITQPGALARVESRR